jgi:hypothetical protein
LHGCWAGTRLPVEQRLGTQSAHDLPIITDNVERMRIRATGEVVVQNQAGGTPTTVLRVLGGNNGAGATRVIIRAGAGQAGVNLLEWQDNTGLPVGLINNAGFVAIGDVNAPGFSGPGAYLHIFSNTVQPAAIFQRGVVGIGTGAPVIGGPVLQVVGENPGVAAARFAAGAGSTPLQLLGVPTAAATDEVLQISPTGEVKKSAPAALISGFAWMLGGNTLTSEQRLGTLSAHDLPIITDNVERMRIRATGEVVVQNQAGGTPTTVLRVLGGNNGAGATRVIIRAGAGQAGVNLLEWQDNTGLPVGLINNAGFVAIGDVNAPGFSGPGAYLHIFSNTVQPAAIFQRGVVGIGTGAPVIGGPVLQVVGENPGVAAARFAAGAGSTPLQLLGVPTAAATDEVLQISPTGEVKKSAPAALISGFAWMLGGNTLTSEQRLGTLSAHDLPIITDNVERMRIRATGEVVVQNQAGGTPTTVLRVLGGNNGAGATRVIIRAGAGQAGVNLLEWQDNTGLPVGLINNAGFVAIGDVNAPGFSGPGAYLHIFSNTVQPAAIFQRGVVGIGTGAPVIGGPVLQVVGENPGVAAARFAAGAGSTPLQLLGVPTAAATDEVLQISPTGEVKKSAPAALISGFAWMLGGNTLTSEQRLGTLSAHDLPIITDNVERMRIRATGEVVVQNQAGGTPTTVLRVLGGNNGAGATRVIIRAGAGQAGVNLLEWQDNTGLPVGLINNAGFVAIGDVNAPGFSGPGAYLHIFSNTVQPAAIFQRGVVGIGTGAPVIGGPVLQVVGENPGVAAARFAAGAGSTPLQLLGVPTAAATDEVLQISPTGEVKKSAPAALISGFAWMLGGNTLTSEQRLGTLSAHDLPIITDNVERMRIRATGEVVVQNQAGGTPTTVLRVLGGNNGAGATRVIIRAGAGQAGVNLLEWQDNTGLPVGLINNAGFVAIGDVNAPGFSGPGAYLHIFSNTVQPAAIFQRGVVGIGTGAPVIGGPVLQVVGENPGVAAARFAAGAGSTPLQLLGVPTAAATDEVLQISPTGEVKKSAPAALISGFAWMLGGNTLTSEQRLGTLSAHDLPIITDNVERMRIRATGEVVVQNQAGGTPTTVLRVLGGNNGAGATRVIIRAGAGQAGVNLLEWQDNTGLPVGLINNAGFVAIGDVNAPGFSGPGAYLHIFSNTVQPAAIFQRGVVGIGTGAPVIGGPVLQVVGENPGVAAARFAAGAGSTPLQLLGVPTAAATDEVLQISPTGEVKKSAPAALISGFAWMLGGNTLTSEQRLGTLSAHDLPIITDNVERMRIRATGEVVVQNQAGGTPTTVLRVLGGNNGAGATRVIIRAGAGQAGVNLLEWQDNTGLPVGLINNAGFVAIGDVNAPGFSGPGAYLHIFSNTVQPAAIFQRGVVGIGTGAPVIGGPVLQVVGENPGVAAARFAAGAGSTPLELQGVPTAAATDEVLRITPQPER